MKACLSAWLIPRSETPAGVWTRRRNTSVGLVVVVVVVVAVVVVLVTVVTVVVVAVVVVVVTVVVVVLVVTTLHTPSCRAYCGESSYVEQLAQGADAAVKAPLKHSQRRPYQPILHWHSWVVVFWAAV